MGPITGRGFCIEITIVLAACVVGACVALVPAVLIEDTFLMAVAMVCTQVTSFLGFVDLIGKRLKGIRAEINKPVEEPIHWRKLLPALPLVLWSPVHGMLTVVMWPLSRLLR